MPRSYLIPDDQVLASEFERIAARPLSSTGEQISAPPPSGEGQGPEREHPGRRQDGRLGAKSKCYAVSWVCRPQIMRLVQLVDRKRPVKTCTLRGPHPADRLRQRRTRLRLLQRKRDLLPSMPCLLHASAFRPQVSKGRETLAELG